jgi:hypothetical protein
MYLLFGNELSETRKSQLEENPATRLLIFEIGKKMCLVHRFSVLLVGLVLLSYEVSCGDFSLFTAYLRGRKQSNGGEQNHRCQKNEGEIILPQTLLPTFSGKRIAFLNDFVSLNQPDSFLLSLRGGSGSRSSAKLGKSSSISIRDSERKQTGRRSSHSHSKNTKHRSKHSYSSDSEEDGSLSSSESDRSELVESKSRAQTRKGNKVFLLHFASVNLDACKSHTDIRA